MLMIVHHASSLVAVILFKSINTVDVSSIEAQIAAQAFACNGQMKPAHTGSRLGGAVKKRIYWAYPGT